MGYGVEVLGCMLRALGLWCVGCGLCLVWKIPKLSRLAKRESPRSPFRELPRRCGSGDVRSRSPDPNQINDPDLQTQALNPKPWSALKWLRGTVPTPIIICFAL